MSFIWTKKFKKATVQPLVVQPEPVIEKKEDKISVIEHKQDGKCLVSSCKENDAFGSREEEVNGQEVVLPCIEDSEGKLSWTQGEEIDSSSLASLKK
jgi:hypothetical protein